jgi:murein DD-endopeptidase MepM/ murein hydrolase activator NlpD
MENLDKLVDDVANLFKKKTQFAQPASLPQPSSLNHQTIGAFQAPLKGSYQNSGNFSPNAPTDARHKKHDGVDLRAPGGSYIYPITEGVVSNVGSDGKGGNIIIIVHPGQIKTYYAHLGTAKVQKGDKVTKETVIGTVGNSGNAKGTYPHVHFQVWQNGQLQDPGKYFSVPKYTNPTSNEKIWESGEAKQEAAAFNMSQHLQQRKQAFTSAIDRLDRIASIYYSISK